MGYKVAQCYCPLPDESSGGSDDWAKGVANVKYVYGLELRPSDDDSRYGFILPATYIVPSGEETWAAVRVVADEVIGKYISGTDTDLDPGDSVDGLPSSSNSFVGALQKLWGWLSGAKRPR